MSATTAKWGLPRPTDPDTADVPRDFQNLVNLLDNNMPFFQSGTFAARPVSTPGSPGKQGRFYWDTTNLWLWFDHGTGWVNLNEPATDMTPIGTIIWYSSNQFPPGYLAADGTAISRSTYAALNTKYSTDGYPWGAGNGTTTFNLPDCRGYCMIGAGPGVNGVQPANFASKVGNAGGMKTLSVAEMPLHSHSGATDSQQPRPAARPVTVWVKAGVVGVDFALDQFLQFWTTPDNSQIFDLAGHQHAVGVSGVGGNAAHSITQPSVCVHAAVKVL